MLRMLCRTAVAAVLFTVLSGTMTEVRGDVWAAYARLHSAECREPECSNADLFYNFYVGPECGGVGAQMYIAPHPVPANVGHTYYTYQPFMPHELLYKHKRVYHRYYNQGRGFTRTSVRWY